MFDGTDGHVDVSSIDETEGMEKLHLKAELQENTSVNESHVDTGTQTEYSKYLLSAKINTMLLKNKVARMKSEQKTLKVVIYHLKQSQMTRT